MRKIMNAIVVPMCLGLGVFVWAHEDMKMPTRPESKEFQQMKQLAGTWRGTQTMGEKDASSASVSTVFKVTAAGSAIEETLCPGTPHEMVDMYTDENGKLAMTHYCAIGNQPHLVLKQAGPTQISLEMAPTVGINAQDRHMHALTLEFPDANHLTERWTSYENGKPGETAVFTFAKVQ